MGRFGSSENSFTVDAIAVQVHPDRQRMGAAAAYDIARELRRRLKVQDRVRMVFAAAPSQVDMLAALVDQGDIAWPRVEAFHMDEYLGLAEASPQRFGNWLQRHLFQYLPFGAVHRMPTGPTPADAACAYAELLAARPIDIVCLGIGVNGHLAFNDPPVADFNDSAAVKIVDLDDVCRQQQVDDGCFAALADVPSQALTVTIPRLMAAERLHCVVPGQAKRPAVARALYGAIDTACPASILRTHANCTLYLDIDSAPDNARKNV